MARDHRMKAMRAESTLSESMTLELEGVCDAKATTQNAPRLGVDRAMTRTRSNPLCTHSSTFLEVTKGLSLFARMSLLTPTMSARCARRPSAEMLASIFVRSACSIVR